MKSQPKATEVPVVIPIVLPDHSKEAASIFMSVVVVNQFMEKVLKRVSDTITSNTVNKMLYRFTTSTNIDFIKGMAHLYCMQRDEGADSDTIEPSEEPVFSLLIIVNRFVGTT